MNKKRSVVIGTLKTSVCLEDEFWHGLKELAAFRHKTIHGMVEHIRNEQRSATNLSSAVRIEVLNFYKKQLEALKQGRELQADAA
jgi:predicted DNA-binding ribbon-helix-helix protein